MNTSQIEERIRRALKDPQRDLESPTRHDIALSRLAETGPARFAWLGRPRGGVLVTAAAAAALALIVLGTVLVSQQRNDGLVASGDEDASTETIVNVYAAALMAAANDAEISLSRDQLCIFFIKLRTSGAAFRLPTGLAPRFPFLRRPRLL